MNGQDLYKNTDLSIEISGTKECIVLQPFLRLECSQEKTLVASFLVDGIEMIESARIVLSPGSREHFFPNQVLIHRPVLSYPQNGEYNGEAYTFTVLFYQAGAVCGKLEKKAFFPAEKIRNLPEGGKTVPEFLTQETHEEK